jgi:hypothetical protein
MLKATSMLGRFWGEAVMTVVYLLNHSSTRSVDGKTPYQAWHGKKPTVHDLWVFSCVAYMKITRPHLTKLDDSGLKMVFIGYEPGSKVYGCTIWQMAEFTCLATSSSMRTRSGAGTMTTPVSKVVNCSWWSTSSLSRVKEEHLMVLHQQLLQAQYQHRHPHREHLLQLMPSHRH